VPWRVARAMKGAVLAEDLASLRAFTRRNVQAGEQAELRLRPLGGSPVVVRLGTSDLHGVADTLLGGYHLPPTGAVGGSARKIWDLGANIGITMASLASAFPDARVIGVELERENFELCRRNVASYGSRCEVVHAGVWFEDGAVSYSGSPENPLGFRIDDGSAASSSAPALSLNTLLATGGGGEVDYVKMDIEGAEREVLREHTEWAQQVSVITVEVHDPYTVDECLADLRALGFDARRNSRYRGRTGPPPVHGVRV
jgi:FkbM family methyltransferase